MGYLLIFLSVCSNLAEGMIVKLQGRKNTTNCFIFNAMIALASMLFFIITSAGTFDFSWDLCMYAIPAAICYSTSLILTYFALSCGSFAISIMILSYSVAFPIFYGIVFLKESANIFTYVAFGIMAVSLYLSREDSKNDSSVFSFKWLVYILTATITSGLFAVIQKMQQTRFQQSYNHEFMILALGISVVVLLIMGITYKKQNQSFTLRALSVALAAGFSNGITNMLTLLVISMLPLSVASPINTSMRIILSFIISALFLRENFLKRQIFGVTLGAIALILL